MREKPVLLPAPLSEEWQWQLDARCRNPTVAAVFDSEEAAAMDAAKAVCRGCPVLRQCREHAVVANEPHGVWGALTPRERDLYKWTHGPVRNLGDNYRAIHTAL
ncbi:WhiB family transcriptional regulator [Rhodococcus fascians]|nr:WhiB family transcriptional regulator [Rhodococcus fascians]MBY4114547.1 WhiB family transcriptional regulator [Rhodococcus fascians]